MRHKPRAAAFYAACAALAALVACTDGVTPDCSDAQCGMLASDVAPDAPAEDAAGDDGGEGPQDADTGPLDATLPDGHLASSASEQGG
jgi:hypothetical protein